MVNFFKKYWKILLIGLILRIVIAGLTFHPDIVSAPALTSAIFFKAGTLNFYDSNKYAPGEVLDDLPLSYLINLPVQLITRPFVDLNTEDIFFSDRSILFGDSRFWIFLIITKLPLLIFDMGIAILLALTFHEIGKKILIFWIFNPITLWATAAVGQFDVLPTFFIVLAYFFIKKDKNNLAAISLGMGGAIKSAPFLLLPLLIGLGKNWKEKLSIVILSAIPYLVTVIPYLGNVNFKQNALFAPQLSKVFFANIPISGGEMIFLTPLVVFILYMIYFSEQVSKRKFINFSVAIFLFIFSFTHIHPQWFLWVTPFLAALFIDDKNLSNQTTFYLLFASWTLMLFLFDSSLTLKLFAPVFPMLDQAKGLSEILTSNQLIFLRSLAATIFAGSSIFLTWRLKNNS